MPRKSHDRVARHRSSRVAPLRWSGMRRGVTLPELLTVVVIVGLLCAMALPPLAHGLDRIAVDATVDRYTALHETTRQLAIVRSSLAKLEIDTAQRSAALSVEGAAAWDTIEIRSLGDAAVSTSQPAVTFSPMGYGWGLSNTTIVVTRGSVAETLTVSRTGRLKRS